jgi:two-component system sensor histidine kinase YesM
MLGIWNRLRKMSIRQKMMISVIFCLISPSIISSQVSDYLTGDVLREQAATYAKESLDVANLYVTDLIKSMVYITNNIQFDNQSVSLLKKLGKTPTNPAQMVIDGQTFTNRLETLTFSKDNMFITVLLPNGSFFTNYSGAEFDPLNFASEPWFSELDKMTEYDIYWVGVHPNYLQFHSKKSPYLLTLARVLKSEDAKPYAYIILSVEEQQIADFFNKYASSQKMILINSAGTVMASPDSRDLGKPFAYYRTIEERSKAHFFLTDNHEVILLNEDIPFSGWRLVSLLPYQNAIEKIQHIRRNDHTVQLAFVLVFVIVLFLLIRRITKPMMALVRVATSVKTGSLHLRANIPGSDEIARLGQVFDQMLDQIELMIQQITEEQTRKRKLELELLQAQINPHFLFNLLNSIRMRISLNGDRESAGIVSSLSKLLRMTINRNNEFQPVHIEVDTVRHYVKLMNFRHNQKIQYEERIASDVLLMEIPRFTIQPLIENAFIHGLNQKYGNIILSIWKEKAFLIISVKDDGVGIVKENMDAIMNSLHRNSGDSTSRVSGIGLKNIHDRMKLIYGPLFQMQIRSDLEQGTDIVLRIPLTDSEREGSSCTK